MSFSRPTLSTLIDRVEADIRAQLGISSPALRRSVIAVLSRVIAAGYHLLYGYMDWIKTQVIIDTAEKEYLERWAAVWNISRKAADYAVGNVTFTGVEGSSIPAGTLVARSDGTEFATDAIGTISGGSASLAVTAVEAGDAGNTAETTSLTLVNPVTGIDQDSTVGTGGLTSGTDEETDADLRDRLLLRIRKPPQGGSSADYEQWALEVSGVTRAWVFPNNTGPGTVGVTFVDDNSDPIIPSGAKVTEVQDYIDARRPVTAVVTVFAPTAVALDLEINISPNTAAVQAAIEAELTDLIMREGEPGGTILLSHIQEAISVAAGETDHTLVSPTANVTHTAGQLPVLGTIIFGTL